MAEGAPLLREYTVMSCIKGSNPFVSANRQTTFTGGFFVPVFLVRARQPFVKRSQERR